MELTFRLDDDDYRDFVKHARARVAVVGHIRAKLSALAWAYWCFPVLAGVATGFFWDRNRDAALGHWYAALFFVVAWVVTWFWYARRLNQLQIANFNSEGGFFKQEQRVSADESGVAVTRPTSTQHFQWQAIQSFRRSDRLFFLHLDTAQALCIPQRAFRSQDEKQKFEALVEEHVVPGA